MKTKGKGAEKLLLTAKDIESLFDITPREVIAWVEHGALPPPQRSGERGKRYWRAAEVKAAVVAAAGIAAAAE